MSDSILVCPHCLLVNKLSASEFENQPQCSSCHTNLLPDTSLDANNKYFTQFITHSTLPIVVDFWGAWSGSSHATAEMFTLLAKSFSRKAIFLRVNAQQEQVLANSYKLINIPTFMLIHKGVECQRTHGALSEHEFKGWLERNLGVKGEKIIRRPSSV